MTRFPEGMFIRMSAQLKAAIEAEAKAKALTPASVARSVLFRVFLADQATIDAARRADPTLLVDSPVAYQAEGADDDQG